MNNKNLKKVLGFYQEFTDYESIGLMAFTDRKNSDYQRSMRQIKASEVILSEAGLIININNQMAGYLKNKLSPVIRNKNTEGELEDTNKLLLSLSLTKVYFEEKEEWVYMPLMSVDVSDQKNTIFKALQTGLSQICIPWETNLIFNEAITSTFFNITYEENGENINEYIAETLEDLIPVDNRSSLDLFFKTIYDTFKTKGKGEFNLLFPQLNNHNSALFMFFNSKNDIKLKREFSKIAKQPTELVNEYINFSQSENLSPKYSDKIWLGSLTKDFPVGKGQGIVMQQNESNNRIIPVEGGPGTGKTTLFLSLIANEVTKRAINLVDGKKDKSNLILVTSTSNKAIENVYSSLKSGFKHGFVYVGGNSANKAASAIEVAEYVEFLNTMEYSKDKQDYHASKIINTRALIYKKEEIFNKIKELNLPFKTFKDLSDYVEKHFNRPLILTEEILFSISKLSNTDKTENFIQSFIQSEKKAYFKEESSHKGFFSFLSKDKILESFNLEFKTNIEDRDSLIKIINMLDSISIEDFNRFLDSKLIKKANIALSLIDSKEKFYNGIQKFDLYSDYFRTNLYAMNYNLYLSCINYMNQEILKNKSEIIKAVSYFISDNGYQYIVDNYGYDKKQQQKFLKFVSMAYPVTTSTLAAVSNMFTGVMKVSERFNTILADEAGMISSHAILPALNMSKRAIVVGDPKQLEPIVPIQEIFMTALKKKYDSEFWNKYSPTLVSAYHRSAGTLEGGFKSTGRGIVLDEHRRCAPKIAQLFIDIADYEGLNICTPTPNSKQIKAIGENLMFFDVKNEDRESFKKVNISEIKQINAILNRLEAVGYNLKKDIGIITPYKDQESALIEAYASRIGHVTGEDAKIGTVHKFQGVEYKVVLFSTVISRDQDSLSFINGSPSLINVAISRAKEAFFTIGDFDKLTEDTSHDNYIGRMSREITLNGKLIK